MKNCELRSCVVGNRAGMFHRWIDKEQAIISADVLMRKVDYEKMIKIYKSDGFLPCGASVKIINNTFGLVEFEDGTVHEVEPTSICFTDAVGEQLHFDFHWEE